MLIEDRPKVGDIVQWNTDKCLGLVIQKTDPRANKRPEHQKEDCMVVWEAYGNHPAGESFAYDYSSFALDESQSIKIVRRYDPNYKHPKTLKSWSLKK